METAGKLEWTDEVQAHIVPLRPARSAQATRDIVPAILPLFLGGSILFSIVDNSNIAIAAGYALPALVVSTLMLPCRKILGRGGYGSSMLSRSNWRPYSIGVTPTGSNFHTKIASRITHRAT